MDDPWADLIVSDATVEDLITEPPGPRKADSPLRDVIVSQTVEIERVGPLSYTAFDPCEPSVTPMRDDEVDEADAHEGETEDPTVMSRLQIAQFEARTMGEPATQEIGVVKSIRRDDKR